MKIELKTTPRELTRMRRNARYKRAITRPLFALVRPWVAGTKATDAVREVKRLSQKGNKGLVNFLGEHYKDPQLVEHAVHEYRHLIRNLAKQKQANPRFNASVSIKPSQFGFDLPTTGHSHASQICEKNMEQLVAEAAQYKIGIEIDMEHSQYTNWTVEFYKRMLTKYGHQLPHFRLCLQANLRRTSKDLHQLIRFGEQVGVKPGVRLVKGVYPEKENALAYHTEFGILQNYEELLQTAFENGAKLDIAVATHRKDIIQLANVLSARYGVDYELQMLKGIGFAIKNERQSKGKHYTEYVPYGKDAISYGWRRSKKMAKLVLGSIRDALQK